MTPLRASGGVRKPGALFCGAHMLQGWFHTGSSCTANPRDRPLRLALAHLQQWCPFLPVGL